MAFAQTTPTRPGGSETLALVFTDARGRVVFVDANLLRLFSHLNEHEIVGQPVHQLLGIDGGLVDALLKEAARAGYVHDLPLTLGATMPPLAVVVTGVATYDDQKRFIGVDIALRRDEGVQAAADPTHHKDVLSTQVEQIRAEAKTRDTTTRHTMLQLYFMAHISALLVLLSRMGGPSVREAADLIANELAESNGWPIQVRGTSIIITDDPPPEAYREILSGVVGYGINLIGRRMIVQESQAVDSHLDEHCRSAADEHRLSDVFGSW